MIHQRLMSKNFTLLTIANFFMAIAFYFMTPVMSVFMADTFHSDEQQVGIAMFAFTIAATPICRLYTRRIQSAHSISHIVSSIHATIYRLCLSGLHRSIGSDTVSSRSILGCYQHIGIYARYRLHPRATKRIGTRCIRHFDEYSYGVSAAYSVCHCPQ